MKRVRGTLSPEQIQALLRQGTSPMVLMARQGYDFTPGYYLTTDDEGNAVDVMPMLDSIPFQTNSTEICRVFPGVFVPPDPAGCECKPPVGTALAVSNPLYPAVVQAWLFNEEAGTTLNESRHGYTATASATGTRWVDEGEGCPKVLEINGGYEYPAVPHALTPLTDNTTFPGPGFLPLSAPLPTLDSVIAGPTNDIDVHLVSVLIRFKAYDTNNYNQADTLLIWKSDDDNFNTSLQLWWIQQPISLSGGLYGQVEPRFLFRRYYYDDWSSAQEEGYKRNDAPINLMDGEWHTVIVVTAPYDTQGQWRVFVDGILHPPSLYSGPKLYDEFYPNPGHTLYMGGGSPETGSSQGHPLWGCIDTVQFFNRQLDYHEIQHLSYDPYWLWRDCEYTAPTQYYDISAFTPGKPAEHASDVHGTGVVLWFEAPRAILIPDGMVGSSCSVGVNPTAPATYSVHRNGFLSGHITIATDGTATFSTTSGAIVLEIGNSLMITAPTTQDATLSDVGFLIQGIRIMANEEEDVPQDVVIQHMGKPAAGELLLTLYPQRQLRFPPDFAGAVSNHGSMPTADATLVIKKWGATIGTIKFVPGGATVFSSSGVATNWNGKIEVFAPSPQDASFETFTITLPGIA